MLAPIAWRTPPRNYGPWEYIVSLLTEGLVRKGIDVTLFATADSITKAKLDSVVPRGYEEDKEVDPKVMTALHIANVFEKADQFDLIHNHFDFLPLTYSRLIKTPVLTTIHGFSSPKIIPVYQKYNKHTFYVAISKADRHPNLDYIATVYHGIDINFFQFRPIPGKYLLFFGRIHPDKGTKEAVEIAQATKLPLIIAGIIHDQQYFEKLIKPQLNEQVRYIGVVGPERKNDILGNALALLHPVNFAEPFGLSVIEAMACGTPVIAFNKGAMPEIVKDQETGFLVNNVAGAIKALSKIRNINRKKCRQWVEQNFTQERMVNDYIKVYQQILLSRAR